MNTDAFDRKLMHILQVDSSLSREELASKVGLSDSQVARRRAALEKEGIIQRFRAVIDPRSVGLSVIAFVHVKLHGHSKGNSKRFADLINRAPSVLEGHALTGDFDYVLKIAVRDLTGLQKLINDVLLASTVVDRVRSEIVLETLRDDHVLDVSYASTGE
jgi:DNA-binding Lrp family transcriptional regulator